MAQFDVYKNPSQQTRKTYPYILDIQHSLIADLSTRIVVPIADMKKCRGVELKGLTPQVELDGKKLLLLMPQVSSVPTKILDKPIGTLSHIRDEIISALDLAITGI